MVVEEFEEGVVDDVVEPVGFVVELGGAVVVEPAWENVDVLFCWYTRHDSSMDVCFYFRKGEL